MPRPFFLSPTAIAHLRNHKRWSLAHFGHATTKKYFQDLDQGLQFIADNHERISKHSELAGESTLSIYPVREHYVVFVPLIDGVHIVDVIGQAQDIPNILGENTALFQRELAQFPPSLSIQKGQKQD